VPQFGPIKRQDLIRYLRRVGFAEPYSGERHQFMVSGDVTIWIPNPHQRDIGRELLTGYFARPTSVERRGKSCNGVLRSYSDQDGSAVDG
jgi:hypothetical protein